MPGVPGGSDPNAPVGGGQPSSDPNAIGGVQTPPAPMQTPAEPVNPAPEPVQEEQGTGMGTGTGSDSGDANGGQIPPTGGVPA